MLNRIETDWGYQGRVGGLGSDAPGASLDNVRDCLEVGPTLGAVGGLPRMEGCSGRVYKCMASDKAHEGGGGCVGATCDAEDDGRGLMGGQEREVRLGASVSIVPVSSLEADFWKPIVFGSRWLGGQARVSSRAKSMQR